MPTHIALKCNYHDGSLTPGYVGFEGPCSADNILSNVRRRRPWCSNQDCGCRQWVDSGAVGEPPDGPCYESGVFSRWRMGTGILHSGPREGDPDVPRMFDEGVALLTTSVPAQEGERVVFGVFGRAILVEDDRSYFVQGDEEHALRIPRDLWLPYEPFLPPEKRKTWGSHLYRYISDDVVAAYLQAVRPLLQSPRDRRVADIALETVGGPRNARLPPAIEKAGRVVEVARKYGPGGEGAEHRRLKTYLHDHPELLGLSTDVEGVMERRYETGDRVDLAFRHADDRIVVEVEVEGDVECRIGIMQAVKYRALEAAEVGLRDPSGVRAILAAHAISETTRRLGAELGVEVVAVPRKRMRK